MPAIATRESDPCRSWSRDLWDVGWEGALPIELAGGVRVRRAARGEALAFIEAQYPRIFAGPQPERFLSDPMTASKRRFFDLCDRLIFRDGEETVGVLVGHPLDWSSYYWRTVALLPTYRGRGLVAQALQSMDALLREVGVQRVQGDTAVNNVSQIRLLHRIGYRVTGSSTCERWGALLRLTKFLVPEPAAAFAQQYCASALASATAQEGDSP